MSLPNQNSENNSINYLGTTFNISNSTTLKICGHTFSHDKTVEYEENVIKRILSLKSKLNIWKCRRLTLEGKIMLVKTFGISRILYCMQTSIIKQTDLKIIEQIIFDFIWNGRDIHYNLTMPLGG